MTWIVTWENEQGNTVSQEVNNLDSANQLSDWLGRDGTATTTVEK
jgi:hypothetical protein